MPNAKTKAKRGSMNDEMFWKADIEAHYSCEVRCKVLNGW